MSGDLLQTKLYVPQRSGARHRHGLVPRPHLIEKLNQGLEFGRKLALISAPAGFGKTTLIADWGMRIPELTLPHSKVSKPQLCWFSLDQRDNDPIRFWTYFIAALQHIRPELGTDVLAMLEASPPQGLPIDAALTSLINDLAAEPATFAFVLDDYHLIEAQTVHEGLFVAKGRKPTLRLSQIAVDEGQLGLKSHPDIRPSG